MEDTGKSDELQNHILNRRKIFVRTPYGCLISHNNAAVYRASELRNLLGFGIVKLVNKGKYFGDPTNDKR